MTQPPLTLGTAGHIDHGKTVLVGALSGVNTDRLPEERSRGISIDLGYAPISLPSGRRLSVVDVPGHERFVRTMVAGVTGIDCFLMVVAADDGVMPQTREHLAVLELLQVPIGMVALTKCDLVDEETAQMAADEVRELLFSGPYSGAPVVPVSATNGEGLDELIEALDHMAQELPGRRDDDLPARLHVDRSFTIKGSGTVVTGTLWSGAFAEGDQIVVLPSGVQARVRGIQVHDRPVERAGAGQRVALNLAGVSRDQVERGDVVVGEDTRFAPSYLIDAEIELLPSARRLKRGARVHLHHGTLETEVRVVPVTGDGVGPGERVLAQLRLAKPVVAARGDRFVLRTTGPADTVGGGRVLDPAPRRHGPGGQHARKLELLAAGSPKDRASSELNEAEAGVALPGEDTELAGALEALTDTGEAVKLGEGRHVRYINPDWLERANKELERVLEQEAEASPLDPARPAATLADAAGLPPELTELLLEEMERRGTAARMRSGWALPDAGQTPPQASSVLQVLESDRFEPRAPALLAEELGMSAPDTEDLLSALARSGKVVRTGKGIFYHPQVIADVEQTVTGVCKSEGEVTIAHLRDLLGTSRKYAQALLEHFDTTGLTRRAGDVHVLRGRHTGGSG